LFSFGKNEENNSKTTLKKKRGKFIKEGLQWPKIRKCKASNFCVLFYCVFFCVCYRLFVLPDTFCESQDERIKKNSETKKEEEREMTSRKEQVFICHMIRT